MRLGEYLAILLGQGTEKEQGPSNRDIFELPGRVRVEKINTKTAIGTSTGRLSHVLFHNFSLAFWEHLRSPRRARAEP